MITEKQIVEISLGIILGVVLLIVFIIYVAFGGRPRNEAPQLAEPPQQRSTAMKLFLVVVILALAVAGFILGTNGHPVLACVAGYLSVTLLFLTLWHYSRKPHREYEALNRPEAAHGCYEQPED